MKKRDFIVIGIVLFVAFAVSAASLFNVQPAQSLCVYVDGTLFGEYSLQDNQEIRIDDTNICEIVDGKVRMTWADCPDQICVHTTEISRDGMTIVCLPNRVVLEIKNETEAGKPLIDGVS